MRHELTNEELTAYAAALARRSEWLRRCALHLLDRGLAGDPIVQATGDAISAVDHVVAMIGEERAVRALGYPCLTDRVFARTLNVIGPRVAKVVLPPPSSLRARATEPWTGRRVPGNKSRW